MKILDLNKNEIADVSGGMLISNSSPDMKCHSGMSSRTFVIALVAIGTVLGISWFIGRKSLACDASQNVSPKRQVKRKKKKK
jgi:hypothetical protein